MVGFRIMEDMAMMINNTGRESTVSMNLEIIKSKGIEILFLKNEIRFNGMATNLER